MDEEKNEKSPSLYTNEAVTFHFVKTHLNNRKFF